jgi:hypothetical protein
LTRPWSLCLSTPEVRVLSALDQDVVACRSRVPTSVIQDWRVIVGAVILVRPRTVLAESDDVVQGPDAADHSSCAAASPTSSPA